MESKKDKVDLLNSIAQGKVSAHTIRRRAFTKFVGYGVEQNGYRYTDTNEVVPEAIVAREMYNSTSPKSVTYGS